MSTKQVLQQILKVFGISSYWLEKFLGVEHAKFNRYVRGITEARFNDINQWLSILGLYVYQNNLYCIEHINDQNRIPLNKESKLFLEAKMSGVQDNIQWIKTNKSIEEREGHKVFWGKISKLIKK